MTAEKELSGAAGEEAGTSSAGRQDTPRQGAAGAVDELTSSLHRRKMHREVTLALHLGIRDAKAEFSFLRVKGLRSLLKALRSFADNNETIELFCQMQSLPQLQVVPVVFRHTLTRPKEDPLSNLDHIFGVDPIKISSPSTDSEVALALRVLEGCCLLHKESVHIANQFSALKVLVNILATRGPLERGTCLDTLIPLLLDSPANQMDFESCNGLTMVTEIMKDEQVDESIRLKCGEFLLLLMGHINGAEEHSMANIHADMQSLLGDQCSSLIWAASQFGSTLDPEERQTALQIQARRVLESLELY